MAGTLQDQLLKAGLIDKEQVRKAGKARQAERHTQQKSKKKSRGATSPGDAPDGVGRKRLAEQAKRAKEANRERDRQLGRKAQRAQLRQLVDSNKLDRDRGDVPWQFVSGGKIRKLLVTEAQREQLVAARLRVSRLDGIFELVPAAIAACIAEHDPQAVVPLAADSGSVDAAGAGDYSGYDVPDDLMW